MEKLKDILGTCYCHDDFLPELSSCTKGPYDIAGVKFTTNMMSKLRQLMWKKVLFIDSEDSVRNALLKQIVSAIGVQEAMKNTKPTPLPKIKKNQTIEDYVTDLTTETIYIPSNSFDSTVNIAFIILITLMNPYIKFYIDTNISKIFEQAKRWLGEENLNEMINKETEFNYIYAQVPHQISIPLNDQEPHFPGIGKISRDSIVRKITILPLSFGTKQLIQEDLWEPLIESCIELIKPEFKIINFSMRNYISSSIVEV